MPNDLIYHAYIDAEGRPRVEPGPLLHHGADLAVFFFNEINRARPQVQFDMAVSPCQSRFRNVTKRAL